MSISHTKSLRKAFLANTSNCQTLHTHPPSLAHTLSLLHYYVIFIPIPFIYDLFDKPFFYSGSSFWFLRHISLPIMSKDWYWNYGRFSSKRGGGSAAPQTEEIPSGCMCPPFHVFGFHPFHFSINNHQQPPFKSTSTCIQQNHVTVPKGAEAPRNSLESEDGAGSSISKEENFKVPKNIRIKTSGSTIRARNGNVRDLPSELLSSSPGTKTPTLVARLMGLELLPDAHSHSSSSSSSSCLSTPNLRPRQHHIQIMKHRNSTDSLPESTPRMSSARRSDAEHRLSLQIINKENMGIGAEWELPRFSFSKRKFVEQNNCRSPSHYARQIAKQFKESVSRKVGHDITNIVKNREQLGKEEFFGLRFKKKSPKSSVKQLDESITEKHSNSYSPRPRFSDTKHKQSTKVTKPSPIAPKDQNTDTVLKLPSPRPSVNYIQPELLKKSKPQALPEQELQNPNSVPKCKKTKNEKFSPQLKKPPKTSSIRNKQEESFITRPPSPNRANDINTKNKRTHPLPSNLLSNVPNLLSAKTNPSPETRIPQKQSQSQVSDTQESKSSTQSSSCSSQRYKQESTHTLATRGINDEDKSNGVSTTGEDDGPEFQYVTGILSRIGLDKGTSTTTTATHLQCQWFSSTHPLDPSIFHHLEQNPIFNFSVSYPNNNQDCSFTPKNQLGLRCNRRLLFDLVDEVLLEILNRPNTKRKKLCVLHDYYDYNGLTERVWKRFRSFPRANCQVLEDIDGLIEREDMQHMKVGGAEALEEEGEGLMAEIEGKILETLVHETVAMAWRCSGSVRGGGGRRRLDGHGDLVRRHCHVGGSRDDMPQPNPFSMEVL